MTVQETFLLCLAIFRASLARFVGVISLPGMETMSRAKATASLTISADSAALAIVMYVSGFSSARMNLSSTRMASRSRPS